MRFDVGEYQALELIDAGGSGRLWRGRRRSTGTPVAIKVMPADHVDAARREAAAAAAVNHPHVVAVIDVVADDERVAVVTEFLGGGSLQALLDRRQRLTAAESLTVLLPLAAALVTAHERQLVHGDVSAGNVVFDVAGRPLLTGLGACAAAVELCLPVRTTARDAAPEVARGGPPTAASDMFSLGSVALACLTGRHAWPADDLRDVMIQAAAGQWPDLDDDVAPEALVDIVRDLLQHDPERRPGGAALVMDLRAVGPPQPIRFESGGSGSAGAAREGGDSADEPAPAGVPRDGARPPVRAGDPRRPKVAGSNRGVDPAARSRSTTRIRQDAVPRRRPASGGRRPSLRRAIFLGICGVVVSLAAGGGLWWAGAERADPLAGVDQVRPTDSGPVQASSREPSTGSSAVATGRPDATPSGATTQSTRPGRPAPPPRPPAARSSAAPASPAPLSVPPTSPATKAVPPNADWAATVRRLDADRARALTARNPALLDAVYTRGSPARSADATVIANLVAQGVRVAGAQHVVSAARVLGSAPLRLDVRDSLPSYAILDAAGNVVGRTTARAVSARVLVLVATAGGYRISDIERR